jgi:hypothetical protein
MTTAVICAALVATTWALARISHAGGQLDVGFGAI